MISTHTLTWSVTLAVMPMDKYNGNFNSHAHVERDPFQVCRFLLQQNFNSHAHVERDLYMLSFA